MTATTDSIDLTSLRIPSPPGRLARLAAALVAPFQSWWALFSVETSGTQDQTAQRACPHCEHPMTLCRGGLLPPTYNCYECREGRRDAIYLTALSWQSSIF